MQKLKFLFQIFISFFKISAFTFGSGRVILPMLKSEIVENKKWLTEDEMFEYYTASQVFPGVIFSNVASLIGIRIAGILGGIIAIIATILPTLICIGIFIFFMNYIDKNILDKIFLGVISCVAAIMLSVVIDLFKTQIKNIFAFVMLIFAFVTIELVKIKVYYVLLIGIILGIGYYFIANKRKGTDNV